MTGRLSSGLLADLSCSHGRNAHGELGLFSKSRSNFLDKLPSR
jgi:hypothetical protein